MSHDSPTHQSAERTGRVWRAGFTLFVAAFAVFTGLQCRHEPSQSFKRAFFLQYRMIDVRRHSCRNNLKQLVLSLHSYHDRHRSFPPAVLTDADGKPLHSWRTLLLPYLDHETVYEAFDLKRKWDTQGHREKALFFPVFQCVENDEIWETDRSSYIAVIGPNTAWRADGKVKLSDITDHHGETILLIESTHNPPQWAEPRDVRLEDLSLQINDSSKPSLSSRHVVKQTWFWQPNIPVVNVAFVDGSVRRLRADIPPDQLRSMLTINGGDEVDVEVWAVNSSMDTPGFYLAAGLLVLIAFWLKIVARSRPTYVGAVLGAAIGLFTLYLELMILFAAIGALLGVLVAKQIRGEV